MNAAVAVGLLVTGLVSNAALNHGVYWYNGFDPTQSALTGLIVAGLTGGVFGALLITGEYSSGTIRCTDSLSTTRRTMRQRRLSATVGTIATQILPGQVGDRVVGTFRLLKRGGLPVRPERVGVRTGHEFPP